MSNSKLNLSLSENDWQIILDSLSNTVFNEDIAEGSRKRAKELFLKLQKEIPKTTEAFTNVTTEAAERDPKDD
jgi:septation ring formation regulator EzrA